MLALISLFALCNIVQSISNDCTIITYESYGPPTWYPDGRTVGAVQSPGWENPISTMDHDISASPASINQVDAVATSASKWDDWSSNKIAPIQVTTSSGWEDWPTSIKPIATSTTSSTSMYTTTMTTTTPPTRTPDSRSAFNIIARGPGTLLKRGIFPRANSTNSTSYVSFNGSYADLVTDQNQATVFTLANGTLLTGGISVGLPFNTTDRMQQLSEPASKPWFLRRNRALLYQSARYICTDNFGFIYIAISQTSFTCQKIHLSVQDYSGSLNETNTTITIASTVTVFATVTPNTAPPIATITVVSA